MPVSVEQTYTITLDPATLSNANAVANALTLSLAAGSQEALAESIR